MPETIHILMEGTPVTIDRAKVSSAIANVTGVEGVHHIHIWRIDEGKTALEAHVVIDDEQVANGDLARLEAIKAEVKAMLAQDFDIGHSTLEFERRGVVACC